MTTRAEIIDRARSLRGTPYHPIGRSRLGADCIGVLVVSGGFEGTEGDWRAYDARSVAPGELDAKLRRAGFVQVPLDAAAPGDALTFRKPPFGSVETHAAVLTAPDRIVHVAAPIGNDQTWVAEVPFDAPWTRLVSRAYRFPGVTEAEGEAA